MKLWKHSLLRIALTCIVIGLVGNLILYFLNASPFNVEEINENKSFNNDINNIQINTAMDDIRIERVSGNTITLSRLGSQSVQYTDRLELTTSVDNGTLYISVEELKKHRFTISARYNVALTLSVPDKIFDSITVTTITGDIHLNNIRSNDIALNSNTGHIHASDTYSRINNIRTITGDINLDGNLMSLKLYSTTGKIAIKLAELAGNIQVDSITGDIALYVDKIVNDIQTTLRTSTGELRTDIPGLELSSEGDKFLTRSLGAGGFQVQISSENGDITFNQSK